MGGMQEWEQHKHPQRLLSFPLPVGPCPFTLAPTEVPHVSPVDTASTSPSSPVTPQAGQGSLLAASSAGTERRRQNPIRNHHACTERTINANISFWTYKMECFSFPMTKNLKNEDYSPILNLVISFLSSSLEERNGGKKRTKFKTLSTTKCECLLLKPSRKKNLLACSLINFSSQLLHLTEVSPQSPWEAWPESLSLPHPQHCLH